MKHTRYVHEHIHSPCDLTGYRQPSKIRRRTCARSAIISMELGAFS
jgi:hypothetical protein